MDLLTSILVAVLVGALTMELYSWLPKACDWLLKRTARSIHESYRDRYFEEWHAHSESLPNTVFKLLHAISCYCARDRISFIAIKAEIREHDGEFESLYEEYIKGSAEMTKARYLRGELEIEELVHILTESAKELENRRSYSFDLRELEKIEAAQAVCGSMTEMMQCLDPLLEKGQSLLKSAGAIIEEISEARAELLRGHIIFKIRSRRFYRELILVRAKLQELRGVLHEDDDEAALIYDQIKGAAMDMMSAAEKFRSGSIDNAQSDRGP